ncbi:MAG: hypothetical protein ACLPV8_11310 [Steroidobacteraceae bacterium]
MASNEKARRIQVAAIRNGERRREQRRAEDAVKMISTLSLQEDDAKALAKDRGSDPYNTSGGFDRTKNWSRVGKR